MTLTLARRSWKDFVEGTAGWRPGPGGGFGAILLGGSGPVHAASGCHVGICSRWCLGFGVDGWGVTGAGPHLAVTIVHTCLGPRRP